MYGCPFPVSPLDTYTHAHIHSTWNHAPGESFYLKNHSEITMPQISQCRSTSPSPSPHKKTILGGSRKEIRRQLVTSCPCPTLNPWKAAILQDTGAKIVGGGGPMSAATSAINRSHSTVSFVFSKTFLYEEELNWCLLTWVLCITVVTNPKVTYAMLYSWQKASTCIMLFNWGYSAQWKRIHLLMKEMREIQVQSLSQEDSLEEEMAAHSSILAWEIPRTQEPGGLQSMWSQKSWTRLSS